MSRFSRPLGLAALVLLVSGAPALAQSSASDASSLSSSAMDMSGMADMSMSGMSDMSILPSMSSSEAPLAAPPPLSAPPQPSLSSSEMASSSEAAVPVVPSVPPGPPINLYAFTTPTHMSPAVIGALPRIYVPNRVSGTVTVIDPIKLKVVGTFRVGLSTQHVVPSWDLKTLYVTNDGNGYPHRGSLTPIDPTTGRWWDRSASG